MNIGDSREQFYTLTNIAEQVNAVQTIVQGSAVTYATGLDPSTDPTTYNYEGHLDGLTAYDKDGVLAIGPEGMYQKAGRIHSWHRVANWTGTGGYTSDKTGYAYSDDLGLSWYRPDFSKTGVGEEFEGKTGVPSILASGSYSNNLVHSGLMWVTIDWSDTNKPLKSFDIADGQVRESSDGMTWTTIPGRSRGTAGDTSEFWYVHGKYWFIGHEVYCNPLEQWDVRRTQGEDIIRLFYTDEYTWDPWTATYGANTAMRTTTKTKPQNKAEIDRSNILLNDPYNGGMYENYMGKGLAGEVDINGNPIYVFSPWGFARTYDYDQNTGYLCAQLGVMEDITDDVYTLIGDKLLLQPEPENGSPCLMTTQGLIETDDKVYAITQSMDYEHSMETAPWWSKFGRTEWRKDGLVKMVYTNGQTVSANITKSRGTGLFVNVVDTSLAFEIQDGDGNVLKKAEDMDTLPADSISHEVTWGGFGISEIEGDVKVKVTGTGDVYSYAFTDTQQSLTHYTVDNEPVNLYTSSDRVTPLIINVA